MSIPLAVRQQVWVDKMGEAFKGKCKIIWCNNIINVFNFHCGHDIPRSQGGTLELSNLHPICKSCNLSMGDKYTIGEWNKAFSRKVVSHYFINPAKCCFTPPLRKKIDHLTN